MKYKKSYRRWCELEAIHEPTAEDIKELMLYQRRGSVRYFTDYQTCMRKLPDNLTITGTVYFCQLIESLPDNLVINGDLDLIDSKITSIPDTLIVTGNLDLRRSCVQQLPDTLIVGGSLWLDRSPIKQLPDTLIVGGELSLDNTEIREISDNVYVGREYTCENSNLCVGEENKIKYLRNGECGRNWIYVNGRVIFITPRVTKRDGYTIYRGELPRQYVVTDDIHYVVSDTITAGIDAVKKRHIRLSQYEHLTMDSIIKACDITYIYDAVNNTSGGISWSLINYYMPDYNVGKCTYDDANPNKITNNIAREFSIREILDNARRKRLYKLYSICYFIDRV